jgi:hypothetical protein
MNSTLVSDSLDDDAQYRLILGDIQGRITRQDGVEYVILCHHPPTWLRDRDRLTDIWNQRARLQLFGHKHRQRIDQINQSVVLSSGAAHPNRREPNWQPAYNILEIWVCGQDSDRQLKINVYPRVWNDAENLFQAEYDSNGSPVRSFSLSIDNWQVPATMPVPELATKETTTSFSNSEELAVEETVSELERKMNPARRLTYRFLRLPYRKRMKISLNLELIEDEDSGLQDAELFSRVFRRAEEKRLLENLWQKVAAECDMDNEKNPYVGY